MKEKGTRLQHITISKKRRTKSHKTSIFIINVRELKTEFLYDLV